MSQYIETPKTAFIAKLQLGVNKSFSYDYGSDRVVELIYNKYAHILDKIYDREELINEHQEGPLYDYIENYNVPINPCDSPKTLTKAEVGAYIKEHGLDIKIINYINNTIFHEVDSCADINWNDATITFTISGFNPDKIGDIDRYIYSIMYKLKHIHISDMKNGESFYLYDTFRLDVSELIDEPETTMDIEDCCWGCIDIIRCKFESK